MQTKPLNVLCCLLCVFSLSATAFSPERERRAVSSFDTSQLLGEWYDVGRTTHIWGPDTWTSQQWNFVQGQDGTVVALFNGMCKVCGGCSDAIVFKVTKSSKAGNVFLLSGNGETLSLTVEADLQLNIVVSICFASNMEDHRDCPKPKLQISVLSRQPVMKDLDQWRNILRHLPYKLEKLDSSSGEGCPRLFIDKKIVTADLVRDTDTKLLNMVGFGNRRSSIVLPCALGEHASSLKAGSKVVWSRQQMGITLTKNSTVLKKANGVRLLHSVAGKFDLLLRGVTSKDVDVYSCHLHTGKGRITLSRVAVSSGGFPSRPVIVYHNGNVVASKGETAILECYVNANPPPHITWWMRTPGQQEAYVLKGKGGNKMRIRDVQTSDEGVYKCEATSRDASPVSALINLQVGFPPETKVENSTISVLFGGEAALTCQVLIKTPDTIVWQRNGVTLVPEHHHSISLIQTSEYRFRLTLLIRGVRREDFGQYSCLAEDTLGSSSSTVEVTEQPLVGEQCRVSNIPVMKDFNVQKYLGDMERMQTTQTVWGNKTYQSEVQGLYITISGNLMQYYRGFRLEEKQCLKPGVSSLVRLDSPGDYLINFGNRGRVKIVYTDYTHSVTYFCDSGDDQKPCPPHLRHVQILSRLPRIPQDVLHRLYSHVQRTCVPVTSLVDTVPGICQMPAKFLYSRGWIGNYPAPNCQVANLQVDGDTSPSRLTGKWHLVGEVRPVDYTARPRNSLYIVSLVDCLILLHRSVESGLCSATEADILQKSVRAGSYYYDYKGRTVDSKFLYVDESSLVLYTCLAVQHDGTCYKGSELVELYHRTLHIDTNALLWLTRAVAQACVDIGRRHMLQPTDACPVPENVVTAARNGMVKRDHTKIGCHHYLIPFPVNFTYSELVGQWTVMYRNTDSFTYSGSMDQFSQTYYFLQPDPRHLQVLVRHYESDWGLCPPTRVIQLVQRSGFGDYVHASHSTSVVFKVLSLSHNTTVVYWCSSVGMDGVCRPESLTVEILARSPSTPISTEHLRAMQQSSIDVCVKLDNLQPTAQTEKCNITEEVLDHVQQGRVTATFDVPVMTCNDQLLKGDPEVDAEKLAGEWTVLWRNKNFWGVRAPLAESSFVIVTRYGLLYLWRSLNNDLQRCGPEEAGRFISTSGPADYYSGFDGVPVTLKILKMDGNSMLAVWCHLDDYSRCHPHRTTIEILSRNNSVDNSTRDTLMEMVDMSCFDDAEWVPSEPDLCQVESDVLTTAYIDGLGKVEYSKIGCRVDLIRGQIGVTDDMIVGSWRSVYQSKPLDSEGPTASIEFHFTKTAEGPISLLYRLYSADRQECLPASVVELRRDQKNSGATFQLTYCNIQAPYGFAYMLYGDGDQLVMLLCNGVLEDGMCDPTGQNLVLLHREGQSLDLNDTMLETVRGLGADACVEPQSLVKPDLEPCPVPQSVLMDAASGQLEACSDHGEEVQCYPRYIPVHADFDIREFAGTWHTVSDSGSKERAGSNPVLSTTYHMVPRSSSVVAMLFTVGDQGSCQPTQLRMLRTVEPGHFVFTIDNTQGVLKVAWMDKDFALVYWCFDVEDGGSWCPASDVSVLSRQPEGRKGRELPAKLRPLIADLCISSQSYVPVRAESCEVPEDIISAVEADNTDITASYSVIQCAQQFVPAVEDFDMDLFSGVWHTVRQTRHMWGNGTWDSLIRSFVARDNSTAIMAFTGHPPGDSHCVPMDIRMLHLANRTGQWSYREADDTVTVKVVWTDYNSSALLYTCSGPSGLDGLCPKSSMQLEFLSRTPTLSLPVLEHLIGLLPSLCVEEEEVENLTTGLCQITKDLEHLVVSRKEGTKESVASCRVQDIPLDKNFTLPQMTGVWYEIARTRFTFNTMESVISVFEYNAEKEYLDGLFIGTLHKQCQSPLKSVTRKKFTEGPESIIEGRIQTGESFFPWITFNILYYDRDVLMHLACYLENEDGTCPRDKTEVTLLGRSRQLTESMEEKLDTLMESVCLSREDLVPTKETADCMPVLMTSEEEPAGLPDTSDCQLNDSPVVQNLNEEDLLGTWYGLGSIDFGSDSNSAGFMVSISRKTALSLQWRRWNIRMVCQHIDKPSKLHHTSQNLHRRVIPDGCIKVKHDPYAPARNGSCQAEKAVYMKAACSGSATGDYISTKASSFMLQWTTVKILKLQKDLMLVYVCTQETLQGTCQPEGIHVDLLSRSTDVDQDDMAALLTVLLSVCLEPGNMKFFPLTTQCDSLASEVIPVIETSRCAVDKLPAIHVDMEKLSGLWYEVAHTIDNMFPMQKAVIVYQALPDQQMAMHLSASDPMGQCVGPLQGRMRQRCPSNPGPETMGKLKFPGIWSWAPWRVLHVNYTSSMIGLSCMDEQSDGSCSAHGLKLHFLARDPNSDPDLRPSLYAKLKALGCFDGAPMEDVYHEEPDLNSNYSEEDHPEDNRGPSCKHKLDSVLGPAA